MGQRPIHKAMVFKRAKALQAVISRGVDLNAVTNNGHTPLELAMPPGQNSSHGKGSAHDLKTGHSTTCLDLILNAVTTDDINRGCMLFEAVKAGRPDLIDLLISKGADPSKTVDVYNQRTPLHWACEQDFIQIVKILIDNGSNFLARDSRGFLPLHYAVSSGRKATVGLLVQSMTDFDIEANNGLTGVQFARLQGHIDIAAMLIQAGA
jgi:ankyrin repeat protein